MYGLSIYGHFGYPQETLCIILKHLLQYNEGIAVSSLEMDKQINVHLPVEITIQAAIGPPQSSAKVRDYSSSRSFSRVYLSCCLLFLIAIPSAFFVPMITTSFFPLVMAV